jgi:hypothetical protein
VLGKRAEPEIMAEHPVPFGGDGSFIMTSCWHVCGLGAVQVCKCARLERLVCKVSVLMNVVCIKREGGGDQYTRAGCSIVHVSKWLVLRLRIEERPPIWRVAANILSKQSRTADKCWSSILSGWARC